MKVLKLRDFDINCNVRSLRDRAVLVILKYTGCRSGEILTIRIEDLDLTNRSIRIFDSKKKCYFMLPLSTEACNVLCEYIGNRTSGYLFPSRNRGHDKMCCMNIRWIVHKFNPCLNPRNFRHYFARYWVLRKGDLVTLQGILRHKNFDMTAHYVNQIRFEEEVQITKMEYDRIINWFHNQGILPRRLRPRIFMYHTPRILVYRLYCYYSNHINGGIVILTVLSIVLLYLGILISV